MEMVQQPSEAEKELLGVAASLRLSRKYPQAIELIEGSFSHAGHASMAVWLILGILYLDVKDPAHALVALCRAQELEPNYARTRLFLATAHEQLGQFMEA